MSSESLGDFAKSYTKNDIGETDRLALVFYADFSQLEIDLLQVKSHISKNVSREHTVSYTHQMCIRDRDEYELTIPADTEIPWEATSYAIGKVTATKMWLSPGKTVKVTVSSLNGSKLVNTLDSSKRCV